MGGVLDGWLRMAGVCAEDVAGAADLFGLVPDARSDDPFDWWDPTYIDGTIASIRLANRIWFRGEVEGLENIPDGEPVLMVGNHSGGTMIADTFVLAEAFYTHFGPDRRFHQLAHDLLFRVPGLRQLAGRWGTVPANPQNLRRALDMDVPVLVYPGGDHETYRPSWQANRVDFDGRHGFVRLALELGIRIVPVAAVGGQETALFLGRGRRLARGLGLDRIARLNVMPLQIAPPFGLTVLDLPGRIPLPAKIKLSVLEPLDLRDELGARPDPCDGYDLVTDRLQGALDDLAAERTLPVLG